MNYVSKRDFDRAYPPYWKALRPPLYPQKPFHPFPPSPFKKATSYSYLHHVGRRGSESAEPVQRLSQEDRKRIEEEALRLYDVGSRRQQPKEEYHSLRPKPTSAYQAGDESKRLKRSLAQQRREEIPPPPRPIYNLKSSGTVNSRDFERAEPKEPRGSGKYSDYNKYEFRPRYSNEIDAKRREGSYKWSFPEVPESKGKNNHGYHDVPQKIKYKQVAYKKYSEHKVKSREGTKGSYLDFPQKATYREGAYKCNPEPAESQSKAEYKYKNFEKEPPVFRGYSEELLESLNPLKYRSLPAEGSQAPSSRPNRPSQRSELSQKSELDRDPGLDSKLQFRFKPKYNFQQFTKPAGKREYCEPKAGFCI